MLNKPILLTLIIIGNIFSQKIHVSDIYKFWILLKHNRTESRYSRHNDDKLEFKKSKIWGVGEINNEIKEKVYHNYKGLHNFSENFAFGKSETNQIFKIRGLNPNNPNEKKVIIKIPHQKKWLILLSSKGYERADAVLSVWARKNDSLKLVGISQNTYAMKIQGVRFADYAFINDEKVAIILERSGGDAGDNSQEFNVIICHQGFKELFYLSHFYYSYKNHYKYNMVLSKNPDTKYVPLLIKTIYKGDDYKQKEVLRDTSEIPLNYIK